MPSEIAIPSTQRAIVNVAHDKPVEIHDSWPVVSPSELAPGECLVKMLVSGVCHSDLHIRDGEWSSIPPPLVGGHEGIGTIVAIGKGTPEHNKVRIGSRVGVKWTTGACDQCEMCRTGLEPLCASVKASGFNMHGTFSEYMVAYVNHVVPIPETLDSSVAAPILCAGVTVYRGLKVSGAKAGHWAVIPGAGGGLGHLAVQYAVAMGLRVMAIDTGDDKRKLCAALGAEEWIDFKEDGNIVEAVKARCKDEFGPHVAVITSPIGATYDDAIAYLRPSGILVALALPTGYTFKTGMMSIVARNITILGSSNGSLREATEAVDFAARNKVKTHVHVHELSEIENIYADMRAGKLVGRAVVRIQA